MLLLLLLLGRFSRVRLCSTPQTAAHQAPLFLGFSRQEHWNGLPFPSQYMKVKSESEVIQSCPTLCDPMDYSPSGSSVRGIFQARVLEWGATAFSSDSHQCYPLNLLYEASITLILIPDRNLWKKKTTKNNITYEQWYKYSKIIIANSI